ncbi:MAG: outer membrane protein assembly factor BamE [Burkholderiaceae bacterium]|nr:outer membrane protein assembly factor BamE [Burkholderiaceae bacterium]
MRLDRSAAAALAAAFFALAGCDRQRIARLEEGVATEADVKRAFGEPKAVFDEPDGGRTFEYPRQPEGQTNYFITIAADGRMTALRQVLKPSEFAKVSPGLDKAEVRRLLGRPAQTQRFGLKPDEELWEWRWLDGQQARLFNVTFGRDEKVLKAASSDDMRDTHGGP